MDVYNTRARQQGLEREEMRAVCVNLVGEEGELEGAKFDVIIVRISTLCAPSHELTVYDLIVRGILSPSSRHPRNFSSSV